MTLSSVAALAKHEMRMTLRGPTGLFVIAGVCLLAFIDAASQPHLPVVAGLRASTFACAMLLIPLSLVFIAGAARRDVAVGASDVVDSRPFPAHTLFISRFLGVYGAVLFGYVLVIVSALLAPLLLDFEFSGPMVAVHAFMRGVVPLLFVSALGYCGVALARNVLAAAVVAVYWLFVLLWGDFLARVFNFTLTQNAFIYAAIGVAVVLATAALRRRQELLGTGRRGGPAMPIAAVALVVIGLLSAWNRVATSHDKPLNLDAFALQMAAQYAESSSRAPGLWLPDQHGENWRTSATNGKALVFAFWSPHVPQSLVVLDGLRQIAEEAPEGQVACLAICLADDHGVSAHVASEGHYPFPMVTDTGTHFDPQLKECAPMSEVFELSTLPQLYVTDRGRRVTLTLTYTDAAQVPTVVSAVEQALAIPVPPGIGVERL